MGPLTKACGFQAAPCLPLWARGSGLCDLKAVLAEQGDNLLPELKLLFPPRWSFRTPKAVRSRGGFGWPACEAVLGWRGREQALPGWALETAH